MKKPGSDWENLYFGAGADKMILSGFKNEALKPLTGKTLAEVAAMRGKSPEETAMDLVVEDGSRVGTVYFLMSEDNVRKQIQLPWMSFGSDAASQAPEGVFLKSGAHPRTRSEEHTSELQSLMRISYAVFCLKKKNNT